MERRKCDPDSPQRKLRFASLGENLAWKCQRCRHGAEHPITAFFCADEWIGLRECKGTVGIRE